MQNPSPLVAAIPSAILLSLGLTPTARSQIVPDTALPNNSIVTPNNNSQIIDGGTTAGTNLFHSFREFSIPTGSEAFFNNAASINNIITRITGGKISNIDGLIRANGTANLFLLNPNGIVFGSNARLDVGGSFFATSAESLLFDDNTIFNASQPEAPPLLTIAVPIGLQFGADPGAIVNRSRANRSEILGLPRGLQVSSDRTLALVGGDVRLEGGYLTAAGGRIELGSVGSGSAIAISPISRGFALSYEEGENFQDIYLSEGATVDVTNFTGLFDSNVSSTGSGDLRVVGRTVRLEDGSQLASFTTGSLAPGSISVRTSESVELAGFGMRAGFQLPSNIATTTTADGNAADITITTQRLIVRDGAGLFTSSVPLSMQTPQPLGGAGNLTVIASESVELSGGLPTLGPSRLSVETRTNGDAGSLQITTGRLILQDGAQITAATSGVGRGGTITAIASESVEIGGTRIDSMGRVLPSQLIASSEGSGEAGNLTIATPTLSLRDRAEIGVSGTGTGAAGNLEVRATQIELDNSGLLSATTISGDRGNIVLDTQSLQLRGGSSISVEAEGRGNGGNLTINTNTLALLENGSITANAVEGLGGNIAIATRGLFVSPDSSITASSQFGVSGTVTINNPDLDPSSGLIELSTEAIDPSQQIATGCAASEDNYFTVTGRGGLAENPTATIRGSTVWRDWQDYSTPTASSSLQQQDPLPFVTGEVRNARTNSPRKLVEANAWIVRSDGTMELVALAGKPQPQAGDLNCKGKRASSSASHPIESLN